MNNISGVLNDVMLHLSTGLIVSSLAVVLLKPVNMTWHYRLIAVAGIMLLTFLVPVMADARSTVWLWLSGAIGQLSVISLILLCCFVSRNILEINCLAARARVHLLAIVFVSGFILYPATLGLSGLDPYVWGFSSIVSYALVGLALIYWQIRQYHVAVVLLIVVAAQLMAVYTSLNSWDYLIDPLVWIFSPFLLLILFRQRQTR